MDVMSIRVVDEENPELVCQFVRLILHRFIQLEQTYVWNAIIWKKKQTNREHTTNV